MLCLLLRGCALALRLGGLRLRCAPHSQFSRLALGGELGETLGRLLALTLCSRARGGSGGGGGGGGLLLPRSLCLSSLVAAPNLRSLSLRSLARQLASHIFGSSLLGRALGGGGSGGGFARGGGFGGGSGGLARSAHLVRRAPLDFQRSSQPVRGVARFDGCGHP